MLKLALFLAAALAASGGSAFAADCAGAAGVPFNCIQGGVPTSTDLVLGGQNNHTVRFTGAQLMAMDHSASPVTAQSTLQTLGLATWMSYLSGATNPYAVVFGNSVTLAGDPSSALQAATKQYVDSHSAIFTGGTVANATTFSSGLTAIGTLSVTGTMQGSGFKIDNTGAFLTGSLLGVSGNLVIAPNNTSSLVNFKLSPAGSSVLQVGGSSSNVAVQTQLAFPNARTMTSNPGASSLIYENTSYTGTSSNNPVYPHMLQATETVTTGSNELDILYVHDTAAAGFSGNRSAGFFQLDVTGAPSATGGTFVGITPKVNVSASMGGTGTTSATSAGFIFGENAVAHAASGATNLAQVVGSEVDVWTETGSSMMDRIGLQVVGVAGSNVAGARDDVMFSLNNQFRSNGNAPFAVGIGFGRQGGYFPVAPTGTMIKATAQVTGDTLTAANGIDWSAVAFSGNSWNDGKTALTGAGQLQMSKKTASGTAPGAGKARFEIVAGSTAGTCSLIAYAGTSTTPYVVTDNMGGGC